MAARLDWVDAGSFAIVAEVFVFHDSVDLREQREVAAHAYVCTRMNSSAKLANDNVAGHNGLAAKLLYAATLTL
ncbi:MAG: hypothetical protein ACI91F_000827 [Candidatus Binatia bacterium]|jgi:hypothetical protein